MRKKLLSLMVGLCIAVSANGADLNGIKRLAHQFKFFISLEAEGDKPARFLYADQGHMHVYTLEEGEAEIEWDTENLGGRASALFVSDLDVDGTKEIVVATTNGRILVYDTNRYDLLWENLQDRFESVECMISADIDRDPQEELIFIANSTLYIYDGLSKAVEWQSHEEYTAQEIILGNVDDDEQMEIILNTGYVIDSRFYNVEFHAEDRFGDRIRLMDMNNDEFPEIIGELSDFTIRIYDIYAERELW
jgi:hypothetical protein